MTESLSVFSHQNNIGPFHYINVPVRRMEFLEIQSDFYISFFSIKTFCIKVTADNNSEIKLDSYIDIKFLKVETLK